MDNENRLIQYLYGEEARPEEVERQLAADDALRAEYQQLRAVKAHLDARPAAHPDPAVVDRVVEAAGAAARRTAPARRTGRSSRADRAPATRRPSIRRRVRQVVGGLAIVLIGVSVGLWQWGAPSASVPGEEPPPTASATAGTPESAIPAWDEAEHVVRLHRHIETLHARSSPTSWDVPGAALQPAGQMRLPDH